MAVTETTQPDIEVLDANASAERWELCVKCQRGRYYDDVGFWQIHSILSLRRSNELVQADGTASSLGDISVSLTGIWRDGAVVLTFWIESADFSKVTFDLSGVAVNGGRAEGDWSLFCTTNCVGGCASGSFWLQRINGDAA